MPEFGIDEAQEIERLEIAWIGAQHLLATAGGFGVIAELMRLHGAADEKIVHCGASTAKLWGGSPCRTRPSIVR